MNPPDRPMTSPSQPGPAAAPQTTAGTSLPCCCLHSGELSANSSPRTADGRLLPFSREPAPQHIAEPARSPTLRMQPRGRAAAAPWPAARPGGPRPVSGRFATTSCTGDSDFSPGCSWRFPVRPCRRGCAGRCSSPWKNSGTSNSILTASPHMAGGSDARRSRIAPVAAPARACCGRGSGAGVSVRHGLTLEQANLDFTLLTATASAKSAIAKARRSRKPSTPDEIRHVRVAMHWLRCRLRIGLQRCRCVPRRGTVSISAARVKDAASTGCTPSSRAVR